MVNDTHFLDWAQREEHAERMVALIGKLYREHSVITTVYGKPLPNKNPIHLIKAHKYARKFDGAQAINMAESEAVLRRMVELNLAPARVDVGKLVSAARDAGEDLIAFVDNALADITDAKQGILSEPRDVVLYGFGRIGRLLARMLVNKVGGGDKARLRAVVATI